MAMMPALALVISLGAIGCGQKGPLTLPSAAQPASAASAGTR